MKILTLICCLISIATITAEKQLNLDDIERDNLASERRTKQQTPTQKYPEPPRPALPTQRTLIPSNIQFGFRPMKQSQTQPQQQYLFQYAQPQVVYTQPNVARYYQQFENVPYVVDNQVGGPVPRSAQNQYYPQQYVYLQPYSAASNNIQMVVDPKGNVRYFMYLPAHLVNVGPQIFTQEPDYPQAPDGSAQYITTPQLPPVPEAPEPPSQTVIQQQLQQQQQPQELLLPKAQYHLKGEPKSLLDSYVPSVLQYQYYKQAEANAIRSGKGAAASELVYNYRLPPPLRGGRQ